MIKVGLYLGSQPHAGGAFQYGHALLDALSRLPRAEFDVRCCFSDEAWDGIVSRAGVGAIRAPYAWQNRAYDRVLRYLPLAELAGRWLAGRTPIAKVLESEPDRIWIFPAQDTMSYQVRVPALVTIFDLMHRYEPEFPEVAGFGRGWRRDLHYRRIVATGADILVDAAVGATHVAESYGVARSRLHVLEPVSPPHITARAAEQGGRDNRLELPAKYFFYPAQFWAHKNHRRLVLALKQDLSAAPDMTLVLAGSPKNAYEALRQQVQESGLGERVRFAGFVPDEDLPEYYRRARALIMPTFFGPTNIPPIEAQMLGCPVACSKIYAMPEQFGDSALYFDPRSVDEMASTMLRLWTDDALCAELAARGLERSRDRTPARQAVQLADILRRVAASRRFG